MKGNIRKRKGGLSYRFSNSVGVGKDLKGKKNYRD